VCKDKKTQKNKKIRMIVPYMVVEAGKLVRLRVQVALCFANNDRRNLGPELTSDMTSPDQEPRY
jgi:hypothetical protein